VSSPIASISANPRAAEAILSEGGACADTAPGAARRGFAAIVSDIVALSKPRIVLMSAMMAGLGLFLAPVSIPLFAIASALVGISLAVAAANALNMLLERDIDARMARTRARPLPAGRLRPRTAFVVGVLCGIGGTALLWWQVNAVTALVAALSLSCYVLLYTPMKRLSHRALLVGTAPGAAPPLLGWAAATGTIDAGALALFGLMVVWQIPHFHAIALFRRTDYANAGLPVTPNVRGERFTRSHAAWTASALVPLGLLLAPAGTTHWMAAIGVALLGVPFAAHGWIARLRPHSPAGNTRLFFASSLLYLPLVCLVLVLGDLLA
jgi:protoheme IX farnesyltransferase